jgi:sensor histidine kinase YesM
MSALKLEKIQLHLAGWAAYIAYERSLYFFAIGHFANFWNYPALYIVDMGLFYFNAHFVLPNAIKEKKILFGRLIIFLCAELILYVAIKFSIRDLFWLLKIPYVPKIPDNITFIFANLFRAIYFIGFSTGYWFALTTYYHIRQINDMKRSQLQAQLENQELEKTLAIAENAYLKSQINPHFLLNTLNFLYNSISKFSEKVADSVMTLSEIMRYALTNSGEDGKVRLEDEIDHVTNFIKLNQARFSQRLCIDYSITGEPGELRVIPLVLITLVENLFKYGDLLNDGNPAKIEVKIDDNRLMFVTENLKKKNVREKGHGIGLKNISERLKMYHDYDLKFEENEQFYRSALTIRL